MSIPINEKEKSALLQHVMFSVIQTFEKVFIFVIQRPFVLEWILNRKAIYQLSPKTNNPHHANPIFCI